MRAFAELLDRLSLTASRNAKLVLLRDYLRSTPDPDRGWALASLTGDLTSRRHQVIEAAAQGLRAATAINRQLVFGAAA